MFPPVGQTGVGTSEGAGLDEGLPSVLAEPRGASLLQGASGSCDATCRRRGSLPLGAWGSAVQRTTMAALPRRSFLSKPPCADAHKVAPFPL